MIRSLLVATLLASVCLGAPEGAAGREPEASFVSPGGRYEIRFEMRARRTFSRAQQLEALDNVDHVEYVVAFFGHADGRPVATTTYVDVYGFNSSGEPTPTGTLFSWFDWSPDEDVVIIPAEGWASAPGTPESRAIALSDRLGWSAAPFALDHVTWVGPLLAIGDRHDDCDYSVDVFDGAVGEQRPLVGADSPIGYRIATTAERRMLIRKVLDNCAPPARRERFREQCLSLSLDTMDLDPVPCPDLLDGDPS